MRAYRNHPWWGFSFLAWENRGEEIDIPIHILLILGGDLDICDTRLIHMILPVNSKSGIVPTDPDLILWIVDIITLVEELGILLEREESMSKPSRNKELSLVLSWEDESLPFSECRRADTQIDYDIVDRACGDSYDFGLRLARLEVESSQYSFFGFWVIVLDELCLDSHFCELARGIGLHKKSPSISENLRFDDVAVGERCGSFSESHSYFIRFIRYCPYSFFIIGFARVRIWSWSIQPIRYATSSGDPTCTHWRFWMICT